MSCFFYALPSERLSHKLRSIKKNTPAIKLAPPKKTMLSARSDGLLNNCSNTYCSAKIISAATIIPYSTQDCSLGLIRKPDCRDIKNTSDPLSNPEKTMSSKLTARLILYGSVMASVSGNL